MDRADLIHDPECTHLAVVSSEGSLVTETDRVLIPEVIQELESTANRSPHLAIGQAADGAWLLFAFGPAL